MILITLISMSELALAATEMAMSKTRILFAGYILVLQKLGRGNELKLLGSAVETVGHCLA